MVFLAFGAKVSPIVIGEVFILASFVGMIPLLPGGLGAIDGIMILFYANAGITASLSAAATVVERLISFWMTTFVGLIFLTMFGTSVLDKAFALAGSRKDDKEDTKAIEELPKEEESIDDSDSDEEEEPALEVLDDEELEEEAVLEVLDDEEKEVLEEKVQN